MTTVRCDEFGRGFFGNENLTGMVTYSPRTDRFTWTGRTYRKGEVYGMAIYRCSGGRIEIAMADGPIPSNKALMKAAEEIYATLSAT